MAHLHVLPAIDEPHIPLPLSLLEQVCADADSLVNDLHSGLDAAERCLWAGSRGAALNEIGRLHARVDAMAEDFAALIGDEAAPHRAA